MIHVTTASISCSLSPPSYADTLVRIRLPTPISLASRTRYPLPSLLLRKPRQAGIDLEGVFTGSVSITYQPLDYVATRDSRVSSAPYPGSYLSLRTRNTGPRPKLYRKPDILLPVPRSSHSNPVNHIPCTRLHHTVIHHPPALTSNSLSSRKPRRSHAGAGRFTKTPVELHPRNCLDERDVVE